ncbi:MAG: hypothetical protein AAGM67_20585, partial [Bacteroidota bacterium]
METLKKKGVRIKYDASVSRISSDSAENSGDPKKSVASKVYPRTIEFSDGTKEECDLLFWTAGSKASRLLKNIE